MSIGKNLELPQDAHLSRYFRLGRHALFAGLKLIQVSIGDRVLVPSFICRDLLASIHAVGAIPTFYEINRCMEPISLPNMEGIRAIVAVNYFGFPQDLSLFREYCIQNNAYLIEDNAHGYLSQDGTGNLLGSRGDLGIFSIRKTFLLPDGAMLLVNKKELKSNVAQQLPFRSGGLSINFLMRQVLIKLQHSTGIGMLTIGKDLKRFFRLLYTGYPITPLRPEDEYELPPEPAPHRYIIKFLHNIDVEGEITRRRRLFHLFHNKLASLDIQPVYTELAPGTVPYGYPFFGEGQAYKEAIILAKSEGYDCFYWPDLPSSIEHDAPLYYKKLLMINFTT